MKSMSTLGAVLLAASIHAVMAAAVPVRFAEGVTHGFLVLRGIDGVALAQGDLLQVARGDELDKRMVFHFKDGSLFDEHVTFTQHGVYALKTYALSQRGAAFPAEIEVSMTTATGAYRVKRTDRKSGVEKVLEGTLTLPADVYNGMILTVVKDLQKGAGEVVHFVAFTPEPRLIQLAISAEGDQKVTVGELTKDAVHYVMKPQLGIWLKLFATILGRVPEDLHAWILTDEVPAFVAFQGSFTTPGPVWRIELVSPKRPG